MSAWSGIRELSGVSEVRVVLNVLHNHCTVTIFLKPLFGKGNHDMLVADVDIELIIKRRGEGFVKCRVHQTQIVEELPVENLLHKLAALSV
jgi:hypothetical protein